jgi:hypothetical protein
VVIALYAVQAVRAVLQVSDLLTVAGAGDCVAVRGGGAVQDDRDTKTTAVVVDCSSSKAAYHVLARVDGETDTTSTSCNRYFTNENTKYIVYASPGRDGYLLCLEPIKTS